MNASPSPTSGGPRRRGVQSVDRALDVLGAFSAAHPRFQLSELAEAAGLPKASTHRIAVTLVDRGFLRQEADGAYVLGNRLLELGSLVSATTALAHLTQGAAEELIRSTGETVLVAEIDWRDRSLLITGKREAPHSPETLSPLGRRSVLANGCISRAILSGLPREEGEEIVARLALAQRTPVSVTDPATLLREIDTCRRYGYAIEINEFIPGIAGVAVPVMVAGRPAGAVAVCGQSARMPRRRLEALGTHIKYLLGRASAAQPPGPP
ncbi:IclR family transcriptional regulator [Actinocorallia sp. A-T 12471]|uniref:IclR family transcriptional regulator n=1 Tax=Actinocorallia sp. A-T 12471 TaxID=3089813 RepID=UPI0029D214D0|nr:IclR family transcriptional regulator [Actinocorallia sp. A-T 12471]MDX6740571.1 IclR family transcriptional regulator [Actinocorallia sp. A-T 12471]